MIHEVVPIFSRIFSTPPPIFEAASTFVRRKRFDVKRTPLSLFKRLVMVPASAFVSFFSVFSYVYKCTLFLFLIFK